jgi:hypothetical protein
MELLVLITIFSILVVHANHWNQENNPSIFANFYNYNLSSLSLSGSLDNDDIPWSDTYWPSHESGIAHRWMAYPNCNDFEYDLYNKTALQSLSKDVLKTLSPAEKYDILQRT